MERNIFLSVVIPCYNEETNIRIGALEKVASFLDQEKYLWEVIIVDDGSNDKSIFFVKDFLKRHPNFSLIENSHQGKATTVITGMLRARGKYVLFSDLDQATPISEVKKIIPELDKGFDVVIGSRNTRREGAPLARLIIARGFMILREVILGLKGITDTQCGFKGFKNEVVKELSHRLKLYSQNKPVSGPMVTAGFDIELLFLAKKMGFKIKEVPVEWHYVDSRRVNSLKDSWAGFWDLVKIKLNSLRGLYD